MEQQQSQQLKLFGTVLRGQSLLVNEMASDVPVMLNDEQMRQVTLPQYFDGRDVWKNYLGKISNQGECGGCYAYAVTGVLQDKFRLYTKNGVKPELNPMEAIMCHIAGLTKAEQRLWASDEDFRKAKESKTKYTACNGGTLYEMARYFYRLGAVEDKCVPKKIIEDYIDKSDELPLCSDLTGSQHNLCVPQSPNETMRVAQRVWPVLNFYLVSESKDLSVVARYMKYDICTKGPLVVGFNVYEDFIQGFDGRRIYIPEPGQEILGGHAVKIVGWGTDLQDGMLVSFWLCANSWGSDWGDDGYYRMQIANTMLETEYNHLSIIPQVPGIMKYFPISGNASKVRSMDRALRDAINVNPFTLYTKDSTQLIRENKLQGDVTQPVFAKLSYTPDPNLFQCMPQKPKTSRWEHQNGRIVLPIVLLLGSIGMVFLLSIVWSLVF